jgi:hypothetical protein
LILDFRFAIGRGLLFIQSKIKNRKSKIPGACHDSDADLFGGG